MTKKNHAIDHILENKIVTVDFINFFIGDLIGEGSSRYVFENPFDEETVIKIDMSDWNANVNEFTTWETLMDVKFKAVSKWFAPVKCMTPCGRILLMQKADLSKDWKTYPKSIPDFFTDIKPTNFGFIGNKFVCVDYGITNLLITGVNGFGMKKVTW